MSKTKYNEKYSYEIFEDGYDIYLEDSETPIVTQRDPYGKVFIPEGTYEENALMQLEEMSAPVVPSVTDPDVIRADIDYMAIMMDVDLPSYDSEEEGE